MDQQADPSAGRRLLDLPVSCLHHIVSFMDSRTRLQFFRTSKGSQDEPGCAVLVLRASRLTLSYAHYPNDNPSPALASLIHWAAQISADMQLDIVPGDHLHSLLVYPDARTTPTGRVLGRPAAYPGVTSLQLRSYRYSSLIPDLVADAFPNLKSFTAVWVPEPSQPPGPVLQGGLPHLQHVKVVLSWYPAGTINHIAQQLSHMPSLTCLVVDNDMLQAVPATVLAQLKKLQLYAYDKPTAKGNAALKACLHLESLTLNGNQAGDWVKALHLHAPSISVLDYPGDLSDEHLPSLLALPHLASLTVHDIDLLSNDYSSAPCSWKHVKCTGVCSSHVTKLPLHALDSPITCSLFSMILSDPTADLAAIRAAKPHLLKCGGISIHGATLCIFVPPDSPITKEQAAGLLAEWVPCLPVLEQISCQHDTKPFIEDAVTQLWPGAEFEGVD